MHTNRPPSGSAASPAPSGAGAGRDFIRTLVGEDLRAGRHTGIVTRFPPEPNGFLHIGHAKSIVLNFGIARETGGRCHLRFDDTNPETEDERYARSIIESVRWLGFDWGEHLYYASDYFPEMYAFAEHLISSGDAYVDSSSDEEIRELRGTVTEPGRPTRFRDRSVEENLDMFRRMRAGEFGNGAHVLRARLDLASPNMLMRDPILYRIRHAHHYRTGDAWCIYPLYDYAHPLEDAIEGVTHSLCTLEFENNRPLYDWVVERWGRFVSSGEAGTATGRSLPSSRPRQYEFARLNLDYTVMSKRKLLELVREERVSGWDDPRLPTLAGLRRRGVPPGAIRSFCEMIGVAKTESRVDIGKLEYAVRDHLNQEAPRVLCVLDPLRVVLTNYPEDTVEEMEAPSYPHDVPKEGSRSLPFSRVLYIDRNDFMETPSRGFFRLSPGQEVRLRYGYVIRCEEVVKSEDGRIEELRCTYDPETRGGDTPDGRTVKGTIQWVSASHAVSCEVRLYDRLFSVPDPDTGEEDFKAYLNPESLVVIPDALVEPSVVSGGAGAHYQFERSGYFYSDPEDFTPERPVFNRTVTLRDTWARAGGAPDTSASRGGEKKKEKKKPKRDAPARATGGPPAAAPALTRTPEMEARRDRFESEYGLTAEEADILTRVEAIADLFESTVALGATGRNVATSLVNDLLPELKAHGINEIAFGAADLKAALDLVEDGTISSSAGKAVVAEMARSGDAPLDIVEARGLRQVSDPAEVEPLVDRVVSDNPDKVAAYRGGRTGLLGFFIGQVVREMGGKANPELVKQLVERRLQRD